MCEETLKMLEALRAIAHSSIVTYYFAVTDSKFLHVGMEFVVGKSRCFLFLLFCITI
jgi:hypothetical protein